MIADVPLAIAGFHPQNFDHEFSGPVTVREALVRSLNIPALRMAQQVGQFNLVTLLRQTGLRTLDKSASHYGLGVALGSGEVTLLDLANAYACFARGGEYRPYRLAMMPDGGGLGTARPTPNLVGRGVPTAPLAGKSCRLFSAEAAYLITDMLSGEERAADLCGHVTDAQLPRIAWKTGTSAGQRDAWTIAFNPEYVVGVWLGNPDGRGAPCLVGRTVAVPLAFAVFRRLYPTGAAPWFTPPVGLRYRSVCAASGCVPTAHCRTTITDTYLPGISATVECPLHRGATTIAQTAEVETFLRSHGMAGKPVSKISDLKINSPAAGERICGEKQELAFSVITDSAVEPVHWFVDGEWYATRLPDERLFWRLAKGRHVIACSDSHNHGDSVQIEVE
jgi:penicillin-binding protein 1C